MNEQEIAKLFEGVTGDPETTINFVFYQEIPSLREPEATASEKDPTLLPVRVEHWTWSGISALSMIFRNEDSEGFSDEQLKAFVDNSAGVTIERNAQFTYVNFGFKSKED